MHLKSKSSWSFYSATFWGYSAKFYAENVEPVKFLSKYDIALFCHKIHYIFMICSFLFLSFFLAITMYAAEPQDHMLDLLSSCCINTLHICTADSAAIFTQHALNKNARQCHVSFRRKICTNANI